MRGRAGSAGTASALSACMAGPMRSYSPGGSPVILWGARTRTEHLTWASTLSTHALSPHLSVHGPVARLAGAPRAERSLEGHRDLGVAPRGCATAPSGRPPEARLGRPRRDRRAGPATTHAPSAAPDRDTRHPARLPPAPGQEQMDLPEHHGTPTDPR